MNPKIFAIELKENFIKTAYFDKAQNAVYFNCIKIKSKDALPEILLYLVNKYGLKTKKFINVSLADSNFIIRDLRLPTADIEEIDSMLDFQIARLTPFSRDEIIFDYMKVCTDNSGYSQLFIPVLQKNTFSEYENLIKGQGIKTVKFSFESEAVLSSLNYFRSINSNILTADNYLFINIDNFDTSILAIVKDKLLFLRNISQGLVDLNKVSQYFIDEINNTRAVIKNKFPAIEFKKIFSSENVFAGQLKSKLKQSNLDIQFVDFFKDLPNLKFNFENMESRNSSSNLALFGTLLNNQVLKFSLKEKTKKIVSGNLLKPFISKTAILCYAFVVLTGAIFITKFIEKKDELNILEKKIKNLNIDTSNINEILLTSQIDKEDLVEILVEFYNLVPQDISLDNLSYNYKQDLVIKGNAPSIGQINSFLSLLKNSHYFKNVQLKYAVKNKAQNQESVSFQIDFYLKKK